MGEPVYKLYYWPLPFRGSFVSYILAYQEIPFVEETDIGKIQQLKSLAPAEQPIPFIGPPVLEDLRTGRCINQIPAITSYLAQELGLMPVDTFAAAMCMKVVMDCNDLLTEICRYNGSMMWDREAWIEFRRERLPRWITNFEESLNRGFIGQQDVTYADIVVFALFGNIRRCMPELAPDLKMQGPRIDALCNHVASKPSLAAYVSSQEAKYGKLYCGGQIEASIRDMLEQDNNGIGT